MDRVNEEQHTPWPVRVHYILDVKSSVRTLCGVVKTHLWHTSMEVNCPRCIAGFNERLKEKMYG